MTALDPAVGAQPIQLTEKARARQLVSCADAYPRIYLLSILIQLPDGARELHARLPITVGDMIPEGTTVDAAAIPLAHAAMLCLSKLAKWVDAP